MNSSTDQITSGFLPLFKMVYAGWLDRQTHRIPNWLTVPALLLGVAVHLVFGGWGRRGDSS